MMHALSLVCFCLAPFEPVITYFYPLLLVKNEHSKLDRFDLFLPLVPTCIHTTCPVFIYSKVVNIIVA
jgi:hypothetical protein